jgi:hypothetical protein
MKSLSQNLIIVSTSLNTLTDNENTERHRELTLYLNLMNIPHEELTGQFGGINEYCVMFDAQYSRVAEIVLKDYDQESYLEHHNDQTCELVFSNGHRKKIGVMREVSEEEALKRNAWTKNKGKYYVAD